MQDFEKLGAFYLGKRFNLEGRQTTDDLILYDAKDLTTHALCVGMTGSGKTGLCLTLLEEAAIDSIPAIVIDPKGDIGNLLLTFPELRPDDFRPWVDESAAMRKGLTADVYAAQTAKTWREGLAQWGQEPQRIARFREAAELSIYTPGSNAGLPLTVLRSFDAPAASIVEDSDAFRERVASAASGLLALLGIDANPVQSREHILISNILDTAWRAGRNLDLAALIREIQTPPFDRVGIMDLETFFPGKDRTGLAMTLNNLLASPSFANWLEGDPLDVKRLLYTKDGKPRISIISIAHLTDAERMFLVTILLNEVLTWMRSQAGTSSLRALLYMDEVFGYFPPTANPPSKQPMLTLLKQARAYGLGVVLATQNPVDLDYKGLSNCGTWLLGRLQTERDKARVLDGLEGASAQAGAAFNRQQMEKTLSSLGSRVFLMNNVHDDEPIVFQTRWALSYLRGPLTRGQIQTLMAPVKAARETDTETKSTRPAAEPAPASATPASDTTPSHAPPLLPK
ncbi:MAG: ATP-binding protein, partial [Planctomycetales bacterium]|nr:ATP-binding protein [Planctomycetales bacterium]